MGLIKLKAFLANNGQLVFRFFYLWALLIGPLLFFVIRYLVEMLTEVIAVSCQQLLIQDLLSFIVQFPLGQKVVF